MTGPETWEVVTGLHRLLALRDPVQAQLNRNLAMAAKLIGGKGYTALLMEGRLEPHRLISPQQLVGIVAGSLLVDIGKLGVPEEIVFKPGRLTDAELSMLQSSTLAGYECVKNVPFLWPEVLQIVKSVREKFNGEGFPEGLSGDDVPLAAQLVSVADFFLALTTPRPYRDAFSPEQALSVAREEVDQMFSRFPVQALEIVLEEVKPVRVGYYSEPLIEDIEHELDGLARGLEI